MATASPKLDFFRKIRQNAVTKCLHGKVHHCGGHTLWKSYNLARQAGKLGVCRKILNHSKRCPKIVWLGIGGAIGSLYCTGSTAYAGFEADGFAGAFGELGRDVVWADTAEQLYYDTVCPAARESLRRSRVFCQSIQLLRFGFLSDYLLPEYGSFTFPDRFSQENMNFWCPPYNPAN